MIHRFAAMLLLCFTAGAGAQGFPSKNVHIIVPFLAGGAVDAVARIYAPKLSEYWGRPVLVENRPGAGGNVGSASVAAAEPDGHTLLFAPHGPLSYNASLYRDMPYDPASAFAPVSLVGRSPNFLIVPAQSSFSALDDLMAAARAKPGQVSYGSQGNGTTPHLTGALLALRGKTSFVHVPYRGFPPAIADLLGGRIAFMFADSGNTLPRVRNNQVRVLAVASTERWALLPEVKTMSELGYPDFVSAVYYALAAPAKLPPSTAMRIRDDVARASKEPEVADRINQLGVEILASTPQEMRNVLRAEVVRWDEVIRATGVKAD